MGAVVGAGGCSNAALPTSITIDYCNAQGMHKGTSGVLSDRQHSGGSSAHALCVAAAGWYDYDYDTTTSPEDLVCVSPGGAACVPKILSASVLPASHSLSKSMSSSVVEARLASLGVCGDEVDRDLREDAIASAAMTMPRILGRMLRMWWASKQR